MNAVCPNDPAHDRFATVAHVMEEWEVDREGNWIQTLDVLQTSHKPCSGNVWTCRVCGETASVS